MIKNILLPLMLIMTYAARVKSHPPPQKGGISVSFRNNCDATQIVRVNGKERYIGSGRKQRFAICKGDYCVPEVPLAHEFLWSSGYKYSACKTSLPCTETMTVSGTKPYNAKMNIDLPCECVSKKTGC